MENSNRIFKLLQLGKLHRWWWKSPNYGLFEILGNDEFNFGYTEFEVLAKPLSRLAV